ncbi:MAG: inositol monophosphatase [Candidatus Buchananbacteria bacterium CG10_big_fil_rev_8_21_14_0_10_42_9]|uniref:Inositol-1-monophosphatase n=1 Tax=Candidatus Buchananbacteria bacterium CG10_big_fil_rev_8_21_14_0_10_42_9 TaxID=1974526 RepID=A0A2H0W091_9BACT|nr:MAG: inositol monophosphatase [Candidatus Buchananbacteria bacterium CG10_big_fil_rev_8_21_14_0_10_42_9]
MDKSTTIKYIIQAAGAGGKVLKKYFGQELELKEKSMAADFQTKADLESEEAVTKVLKKHFPNYNIHGEENGLHDNNSEWTFYIDPLDGTNNFVIGLPHFSVNIVLLKNKAAHYAVTHQPILNNTYYAVKGQGAFLNNSKITVSNTVEIPRATIATQAYYDTPETTIQKIHTILYAQDVKRILSNWSPALDYGMLAAGKIDGIINYGNEIYDFAAGKLIAREAGAKITTFDGQEDLDDLNPQFIASNGTRIHSRLLDVLK